MSIGVYDAGYENLSPMHNAEEEILDKLITLKFKTTL